MKLTLQQLRKEYRDIYELLWQEPRIEKKDVSEVIDHTLKTTSKRMKEAFVEKYILGPHLKRKSFKNFREYVYFVHCEDPLEMCLELEENQDVVYHAKMDGFANLWVISKKMLDIDGVILVVGIRSDYIISHAPNYSLETAVEKMWDEIRHFDSENYTPKGYIKTHWDETAEWSKKDEILFREFKYKFRKALRPTAEKHHIWCGDVYDFLEKITEYCTIITYFFPKSIESYDPCLIWIETEYEDFIIDLFSKLPTSCLFFKVSGKLFVYVYLDRKGLKDFDSDPEKISQLYIPFMLRELKKNGIVKKWNRAIVAYHWRKDL